MLPNPLAAKLDDLHGPARLLDLLARGLGEVPRLHGERVADLAVAEALDAAAAADALAISVGARRRLEVAEHRSVLLCGVLRPLARALALSARHALHRDEVGHLVDHPAHFRRVREDHALVALAQAHAAQ